MGDRIHGVEESRFHRQGLLVVLLAAALLRLVFALGETNGNRFWDERYGFQNVAAVLVDGQLRPEHALYPSLSFLPHTVILGLSQGLHEITGASALNVFHDRERKIFSPTAYRLSRAVSVLFGVWSLWLLYRLSRRLFDPSTALLATLLLATFWRHVWASGEFKPDILVVALTLLSLEWSLEAVKSGSWVRYLLAGAGIGLATAAKYNAAVVALPLGLAVALRGRHAVRLAPRLGAAALFSLLVFLALNPWVPLVVRDFRWQVAYYEREASRHGSGHWQVLLDEGEFFLQSHGLAVFAFVVIGILVLSWRAIETPGRHSERIPVLVFAVGYPVLYAAITPFFLSQNMLPVVPLTCLFGAWAVVAAARWLGRRWPKLGSPAIVRLAGVAVFLLAFRSPVQGTYLSVVPTTEDRAAALLAQHLTTVERRTVFHERHGEPIHVHHERLRLPIIPVPDLTAETTELLDLADGEIFPGARLEGERAELYVRRITRLQTSKSWRLTPRPFVTQGQELVVILHPWHEIGEPVALSFRRAHPDRLHARLPGQLAAGEVVSFSLYLPRFRDRNSISELHLNGETVPLYNTGVTADNRWHLVSHRRTLGRGPGRLTIELTNPPEGFTMPELELRRWRMNEPPEPASNGEVAVGRHGGPRLLPIKATGLPKDSVANASQIVSIDRSLLADRVGRLGPKQVTQVLQGIDVALGR